ncbi:peptide/nickel transport system substrate-binding protein [Tissierella praeacuta DSM 18095]|uniref:Peptide/nickel transport system substrate-binding protein n=1 Tax=Tissierella praeacuta DSM 18095 TaxID=1123404 RepID=A0A1M4V1D5_9FIRM|nr:glutathione ABC transporter substrate-binding protein [Tissierella praeacuta]TCU74026.1 peptide/nickel transport system substrate-binding protein [Tissierella praeacuta]SHE62697.1 peptide/nickel transport system substrate-binding protein [Tissierella praeacuta DSM 18095]SUP02775.1 Dipeptide-binding protein [Tissierella praeacuta]
MFKNKKILSLVTLTLVLSLVLTACGGSKGIARKNPADTLVVAQGADAKSLDPHATNDQPSSRVTKQIYNTLVFATEDMEIVPSLAESWEKLDDLTWEFKLAQGVKFHNGEELKASDVKFTFDRMLVSPSVSHILGPVTEIKVVDDYTVQIITSEPFAPLLAHLTHTASSILNEKAVTEYGADYGQKPVGTGPFKVVDWQSGDRITLERFDDYFKGAAKIKTVIFRNVPEGTNRTVGLETGEIDIAYDVEPIDKKVVEEAKGLELIEGPSFSSQYLGFNTKKAPFDNVKVRQAINYAVNVQEIIDVALEGAGEVAKSPLTDLIFGADKDIEGYSYDVEKAKELLKEAGYENGFKTSLWTNDNPVRVRIAEMVQAQLKEVGIDTSIEVVEWGAFLDRTSAGEHDMFILGWTTVTGDADYGLYALYHSSQHGDAGNRTFYSNPEVDKLLDIGKTEVDTDKRLEAYKEAQNLIVEDAPQLFLYFSTQNAGENSAIQGFKLHPAGHHSLYNVTIQE